MENLTKEVKTTHLTNFMFDGARAEISRTFSASPLFQTTHGFTLGAEAAPPTYNFSTVYATNKVFMQGGIDHAGNLNMRYNQSWNDSNVAKISAQLSPRAGQNMINFEHDYQGLDYSLNFKAMNPGPTDLSGIFVGSYLQSVTKNLALGVETVSQRQGPMSEQTTSYVFKYTGNNKNWIATAQLHGGAVQATYWQKFGEKVDMAADLQVLAAQGRRDALATIGARWELRMAAFRAQIDTTGKVSALLEQRYAPALAFLVSGEIDHFKNSAKFGLGVMVDSPTLSPEEMEAQAAMSHQQPPV
ncbi:hypothetical protein M422DRAFT_228706 [Sphaerobolus stellatus SS14]|uniref:Mitochondrial import receptor subunit TOM40 n=1 Tax=Sphaerobolus stellatus (strain SS14) TaxID=990650 RepID=A0A0C9ULZ1_SPHS4|nr:hypothetical protein M422DRAFT_228706 [Sphaerobolus stellatus SS14]